MEEIILFGVGKYFKTKISTLMKSYKISVCIDNCVLPSESKYMDLGLKVINPVDLYDKDKRIFLLSVNFIPMWRQLINLGIEPGQIVFPYDIQPYFENDEALTNGIEKMFFKKDYICCKIHESCERYVRNESEWRTLLRDLYRKAYPVIEAISSMGTVPISQQFGTERGTPVDRRYIETILEKNQKYITGDVLEIEDSFYTNKYGANVSTAYVMDVSSTGSEISFNANLETGEGIRNSIADCFILTQTLMYIFDLEAAVNNIFKLLKPGGTAIITCSGISQNSRRCMDNYGCIYSFNTDALVKLFGNKRKFEIVDAGSYGNVKTVMAHIAGLCTEDLDAEDFVHNDKYYPLISYIVVRRVRE